MSLLNGNMALLLLVNAPPLVDQEQLVLGWSICFCINFTLLLFFFFGALFDSKRYSLHVPNASVYDLIAILPGLPVNATFNPCAYLCCN